MITSDELRKLAERICEYVSRCRATNTAGEIEAIEKLIASTIDALQAENERLEKALEEEIENRDHFERQVSEIHKALGGSGEWVTRIPTENPPNSGDCFLDSLALIDELMTQRTSEFIRQAMNLEGEQVARDQAVTERDALRARVAELKELLRECDGWLEPGSGDVYGMSDKIYAALERLP